MNPEISVILPVYNGGKYLREAIDSILNQTFKDFEFIIIDDGSTDDSSDIINMYSDERIKFIKQNNKGLAYTLNIGIKNSSGRYIARMDQDDISHPERFEKQYKFMESHHECVVVGSAALIIDMDGEFLYNSSQPSHCAQIKKGLPSSPFFHSSTMFRKRVVLQCGGYYEEIRHHFEDLILWNKMAQLGELRNIAEPLIKYRLVPSAMTNRSIETGVMMRRICENILQYGRISQSDSRLLQSITQERSKGWKWSNYYLRIGKVYIERNFQRKKAFINLILSIQYSPLNGKAWFNLILLFLPLFIIKKWKQSRKAL